MKARCLTVLACSLIALLAGCGQKSAESGGAAAVAKLTPVPHAAWLSRHLPAEAIAYARIPSLWDALTEPKEDALHPIQAGDTHTGQIAAIRKALVENVLSALPPQARLPAELFLSQLQSPLEVAALKPGDGSFAPNTLIAAAVAFADATAFADWVTRLTADTPQLRVLTPMNAEGYTTLMAGPLPVYGYFNAADQRLLLLTGASASQGELVGYSGAAAAQSPLSAFEAGIDATGRGLALWLDVARLYPMYQPMLPPEQTAPWVAAGLDQAEFVWLGAASKGGKSSFKIHLQMPEVGFRKLLARPDRVPALKSAGAPDLAFRLALPSITEVGEALEYAFSLGADGATLRAQATTAKAKLDQALGFDSRLFLQAFGPEILAVGDQAGFWAGYQIRDQQALDQLLAAVQKQTGTTIATHRAGGIDINYWALPAFMPGAKELAAEGKIPEPWAGVLKRVKTRLYWIQEGDYLTMAGVPQVLAARAQIGADRDIGQWLSGDMQLDWEHSILALASRAHHTPRDVYHAYLAVLSMAADLAGAEIDPFAMPTWIDGGLPEYGRLGLRLDSGPESLSLSMDYEYTPMEVLFGGNSLAGVAVIGIVAAIAIPAYNDYALRAEVANALAATGALKGAVAEAYLSSGRFPNESEAEQLLQWTPGTDAMELAVEPDTGIISIYFTENAKPALAGSSLFLEPADAEGSLIWSCYSDEIQPKLLPASCRE